MFSGLVSGKARIQRLEQEGKTIVLTVKTFPENLAGVKSVTRSPSMAAA